MFIQLEKGTHTLNKFCSVEILQTEAGKFTKGPLSLTSDTTLYVLQAFFTCSALKRGKPIKLCNVIRADTAVSTLYEQVKDMKTWCRQRGHDMIYLRPVSCALQMCHNPSSQSLHLLYWLLLRWKTFWLDLRWAWKFDPQLIANHWDTWVSSFQPKHITSVTCSHGDTKCSFLSRLL